VDDRAKLTSEIIILVNFVSLEKKTTHDDTLGIECIALSPQSCFWNTGNVLFMCLIFCYAEVCSLHCSFPYIARHC
jgi:hypothetical protein